MQETFEQWMKMHSVPEGQRALVASWLEEEKAAHMLGWDFSHLDGRWQTEENDLPWNYRSLVVSALGPETRLLDLDTGGGEFLLSLGHPARLTSATEYWPTNVRVCRQVLVPRGIDFHACAADGPLPFADESFDLVINRHGSFDAVEIMRVLKPGGRFVTQQVGEDNDRELVEMLLPKTPKPFPGMNAQTQRGVFEAAGFQIERVMEAYRPIRFLDVGALVWFARIIEWEFPNFSVEACLPELLALHERACLGEKLQGRIHRYMLQVQKPTERLWK